MATTLHLLVTHTDYTRVDRHQLLPLIASVRSSFPRRHTDSTGGTRSFDLVINSTVGLKPISLVPCLVHEVVAAYGAAAIGGLVSGLIGAVWLVNRRLENGFNFRHRDAAVFAAATLLTGGLFAVLGAETLATTTPESVGWLIGVSLLGVLLWTLVLSVVLIKPVRWYIGWARPPAVLRQHETEEN